MKLSNKQVKLIGLAFERPSYARRLGIKRGDISSNWTIKNESRSFRTKFWAIPMKWLRENLIGFLLNLPEGLDLRMMITVPSTSTLYKRRGVGRF